MRNQFQVEMLWAAGGKGISQLLQFVARMPLFQVRRQGWLQKVQNALPGSEGIAH